MAAASAASSGTITAASLKAAGDKAFGASDFEVAAAHYTAALECAEEDGSAAAASSATPTKKVDAASQSLVAKLYSNLAAAQVKTGEVGKAMHSAREAVRLAPSFPRAFLRVVVAHREAGDAAGALALARWGRKRFPSEASFGKLAIELESFTSATASLSWALDSMLGSYFAANDAMDTGKSAGEAKEASAARAAQIQEQQERDDERRARGGSTVAPAQGRQPCTSVDQEHWAALRSRLEAVRGRGDGGSAAALPASAPAAVADEDALPEPPSPTDASVGVAERIAASEELRGVARASLRAGHLGVAEEALDRALRCLSLRGSVDPADRAAAEHAKVAVFADKSLVSLLSGEFDDADDHCERVLARVARTTMQSSFVLKGDAKADWDAEEEARMTAREAVALLGDGRGRAASAAARKAVALRPRDVWLQGLAGEVERLCAERKAAKAARAATAPGEEGSGDDDESESGEEDEEEEEGTTDLEGTSADPDDGVRPVTAIPGAPASGVPVLIVTDTTFRLSERVAVEFVGSALAAAGLDGAPVRPRVLDVRFWPFIEWEREHIVVFVVSPLRQQSEQERCLPGLFRWLASAQPSLAHLSYAVVSTGHSGYFPNYEQLAVWLDHMIERLGAFSLIDAGDVDTSTGRSALEETGAKWAAQLASVVQESLKSGAVDARPVAFDYLGIRLSAGRPSLPVYRLAPAHATVAAAFVLGAGAVPASGAEPADGAATAGAIAKAAAARGRGTVAVDITLDLPSSMPPTALEPGDAVGIVVPNSPADVLAVVAALGVPPTALVPPAPWAFSEPSASPPTRRGGWTPVVEAIATACPGATLDAIAAIDPADAPSSSSASSAVDALPPLPPCLRRAHVALADALRSSYSLAAVSPALVSVVAAMRSERGLPAFPAEVEANLAGDPSLLAAWTASHTVASFLEAVDVRAARLRGVPSSAFAARILATLATLPAIITPVSDGPAARRAGQVTIRCDLGPDAVASLRPGSRVLAFPSKGIFPPAPVEHGAPLTILASAPPGVGLARSILYPRLRSGAAGAVTVVFVCDPAAETAHLPAAIDAASSDDDVAAIAASEALVPGAHELAVAARAGHCRLVLLRHSKAAGAAPWPASLALQAEARDAIADAVAPAAPAGSESDPARLLSAPVLFLASAAETGGAAGAQAGALAAVKAARGMDDAAAAAAWTAASAKGRIVVAAF